jgi:hypothetical protein
MAENRGFLPQCINRYLRKIRDIAVSYNFAGNGFSAGQEVGLTLHHARDAKSECAKLQRLLDRYRDLLAYARDELLRRGIERQINSLEQKLRACDAPGEQPPAPQPGAERPARPVPLRLT